MFFWYIPKKAPSMKFFTIYSSPIRRTSQNITDLTSDRCIIIILQKVPCS